MIPGADYSGTLAMAVGLLGAMFVSFNASPALRRTGLALVANWLACMAAVALTGTKDPWLLFIIADACAALIVLSHPASKPQAIIGVIYVVQITFHIAYALVSSEAALGLYLNMLSGGGWLQIAVLAGGAIHHGSRKRRAISSGMGSARSLAIEASASRMDARR